MKKIVQKNYLGGTEMLDPQKHTIKVRCRICGDDRWFPPSSTHQINHLCKPCTHLCRRLRRLGMKTA